MFWIALWTIALIWFLSSGRFNNTESIGLILVWLVMVGATAFVLYQHFRASSKNPVKPKASQSGKPNLNAPCPCGSGKKYKRCCGA